MEAPSTLQVVWFVLVGVLLAGYSLLDGFDLGIGFLFPALARTPQEKSELLSSIGPFWDGNEVWIITGAGALFAAFPLAYAAVFSGFYLALMLVLFCLILRAASLEFRSHTTGPGRKAWERVFIGASALPALLFGVAVGNVVTGVPLDSRFEFSGTLFTLMRPLPLCFGLLGLAAFALQGSAWAALKTTGPVQRRAHRALVVLAPSAGGLILLTFIVGLLSRPAFLGKVAAWAFTVLALIALAGVRYAAARGSDRGALLFSSFVILCLWGTVGALLYPHLVRGEEGLPGLTISGSSSTPLTLKVMLIIALVGMPFVIGYTIFAYKIFKGRTGRGDGRY
jgi:cytochrome d ubiquinol oxidase subunit II